MNAHQPRTTPRYGYDSTYSSFQSTGMPIFGYAASADRFIALNLEASVGNVAKFRQFTDKERDSESGLDYFGARYYGSALGRFTSPDPSGLDFADLTNPQSLNLYVFVMNNPLSSVDPNGLSDEPCGGGGSVVASKGEGDGPDPCGGGLDPAPKPLPPDKDCAGKDCQQDPVSVANDMGTVLKVLDKQGTCIGYALREVAALGEGMDREPDSGYGTVVKGTVYGAAQQFAGLIGTDNAHVPDYSSLQGHPHIHVWVNSKTTSDAFGRYQIMGRSAGGMANFSRAGQDAHADRLMRARGAVGDLLGGNFSAAMAKASKEWASLPFSPYGQPAISLKSAAERFLLAVSVCR